MSNNHPTGNCEKKEDKMEKYWSDFFGCNFLGVEVEAAPERKGIRVVSAQQRKFENLNTTNSLTIRVKNGPKKVAKQTAQESEGMEI